jgi:hypothetical protein
MRRFLLLLLVVTAALGCGACVTTGESDFLAPKASLAGNLAFETTVFIDQAQDRDAAWQMGEYAALLAGKSRARVKTAIDRKGPVFSARIQVVQRSYVERLAIKTSIFGELCISGIVGSDDEDTALLRHSYYYLGKGTILSAKMQERIVKKLLKKALARQRSHLNRQRRLLK